MRSVRRHRAHPTLPARSRRDAAPGLLDVYETRLMLTCAVSLMLLVVLVRLPWYAPPLRMGWTVAEEPERITLQELREKAEQLTSGAPPVTVFQVGEPGEGEGPDEQTVELQPVLEEEAPPPPPEVRPSKMNAAVLDFSERMPEIVGGLGAYYININYPDAARQAGIQGRLVLTFIVEPDGLPTHIEVAEPLHPLCDSAAVRALRDTRFVPGRHNGEIVRVRMRLPVRFRLIDAPRSGKGTRQESEEAAPGAGAPPPGRR